MSLQVYGMDPGFRQPAWSFVFVKQPSWAPVWRGGRTPRKMKKRLRWPMSYWKVPYTYVGHPRYEVPIVAMDRAVLETWGDTAAPLDT